MRTWVALFISACVVGGVLGQSTPATPGSESTAPKSPPPKSGTANKSSGKIILDDKPATGGKTAAGKTAPGGKAAPSAEKKKEEPAKIEGMEILRGTKGFLGVQVAEGRFKINFYDAKKKPTKPDVARAALRWDPKYKVGMERVVLTPTGENALSSERFIRPPYNFKLFITLLKDASGDGEDPVGESYTVDFKQ